MVVKLYQSDQIHSNWKSRETDPIIIIFTGLEKSENENQKKTRTTKCRKKLTLFKSPTASKSACSLFLIFWRYLFDDCLFWHRFRDNRSSVSGDCSGETGAKNFDENKEIWTCQQPRNRYLPTDAGGVSGAAADNGDGINSIFVSSKKIFQNSPTMAWIYLVLGWKWHFPFDNFRGLDQMEWQQRWNIRRFQSLQFW